MLLVTELSNNTMITVRNFDAEKYTCTRVLTVPELVVSRTQCS